MSHLLPNGVSRADHRRALLAWYGKMADAFHYRMSPSDKEDLLRWDREYVNGSGRVSTSDWPGWLSYIGPRPEGGIPYERPRTPKAPIRTDLRWDVWERDNFTCQWCGSRRRLSVDHIVPESKGGPTTLDNLQTLCSACNNKKGIRLSQ